MSQIRVRNLGAASTWDPFYGSGKLNYITDLAAVTQLIRQRLLLLQGEFWQSLGSGTPMFQSILGHSGRQQQAVALLLQQRILGTPFVTGISNVQTSFIASTRRFTFACTVQTQFGTIAVTVAPGSAATLNS